MQEHLYNGPLLSLPSLLPRAGISLTAFYLFTIYSDILAAALFSDGGVGQVMVKELTKLTKKILYLYVLIDR